jgi:hypothetical protein
VIVPAGLVTKANSVWLATAVTLVDRVNAPAVTVATPLLLPKVVTLGILTNIHDHSAVPVGLTGVMVSDVVRAEVISARNKKVSVCE